MSIEVRAVSKFYGSQKALNNISFSAARGEIIGFIGPNGAGKSTTMKIIAGIIPPDSGNAFVCGQSLNDSLPQLKQKIGYLPENNPLYPGMYIKEYLYFAAGFYMPQWHAKQRVAEIIKLTGLEREQHKLIGQLSKGYRQRVGLAQALLHNPEVLILDEPTTGLDPNQLSEIRNLIKETAINKTILLSTHIMQEVEAICHRVIMINQGEIVANGTPAEIKSKLTKTQVIQIEFGTELTNRQFEALALLGKLQKIDGCNWLLETDIANDPRAAIFDFAVNSQLTVLSMQKRNSSLEAAFRELSL